MHRPRPRSWIALAGLVLLAAVLPVSSTGADEAFDTVLITVEAGPEGAEGFRMEATYGLDWETNRPRALGSGIGAPEGGFLSTSSRGSGRFEVTTTEGLTGSSHADVPLPYRDETAREHLSKRFENEHFWLSVDLDPEGRTRYFVYLHELEPDSERVLLVFHAGAEMVDLEITDPAVDEGSAAVTDVQKKHGARVLQQADPKHGGTAVGAGPAAAGTSRFVTNPDEGIAGEIFQSFLAPCPACTGTITAPDGTTEEWARVGPFSLDGNGRFVGPAGTWGFSWTGLGASASLYPPATAPSFGAYTTVGELWPWFEEP